MATLKEVARLAGVSASTVSRIINGKGEKCAGAAVQKRVWDAVRATGYVPNQRGQFFQRAGGLCGGGSAAAGVSAGAPVQP